MGRTTGTGNDPTKANGGDSSETNKGGANPETNTGSADPSSVSNDEKVAALEKEVADLKEALKKAPANNDDKVDTLEKELAALKETLEKAPKSETIIKRAEDVVITVFFMGQNGEGLADKVLYGSGKSKTFRNFRDKATMPLTEFEQEFAQAPLAINFFRRGLLVLGADTPQSVLDSFEVDVETNRHLSKKQYKELLTRGVDTLVETYKDVCAAQKELILETVVTAIETGNRYLTREMVEKLNNATKVDGMGEGKLKNHLIRFDEKAAETY